MTTEPQSVPTGLQLTALDPAFRENPHPVLAWLRDAEPVHYDAILKRWILTHDAEILEVLRDRTLSVDARNAADGTYMKLFERTEDFRGGNPSMLFADPPYHTRLRSLVTKAFSAKAVEALAPRIREIADTLLDAVEGAPEWDLIAAYAGPLPVIVIAEMLGVDPADRADFKRWSDTSVTGFNPVLTQEQAAVIAASMQELDDYLRRAIAARRAEPREDLITALIHAREDDGDQLTEDEIVTMCGLLLAAGNVTTTDLIGNAVLTLLEHREQWNMLRRDPSLLRNAVEEVLRYEPPVLQTGRIATRDLEIGGCPIKRGESILTVLAAAGRDPETHTEPDRFDITRSDTAHQAFGGGVHFCLGAPLARLEGQIALERLIARFPDLNLAEQELEWLTLPVFRGLERLIVRA